MYSLYEGTRRYQEIVFTQEEFGEQLRGAVNTQVNLLLDAGYEINLYQEEAGIIVIRFNYNKNREYENASCYWLDREEADNLISIYEDAEDDKATDDWQPIFPEDREQ